MTTIFEDQKSVLRDFTERLEKLGINYMLTGSMAMVNYAIMRMTADISFWNLTARILLNLSGNLRRIITYLKGGCEVLFQEDLCSIFCIGKR